METDEEEEEVDEEDEDADAYDNQDGVHGIQINIPTEADIADIEDVFGQGNGNLFSSDNDNEDDQGMCGRLFY